MTFLHPEILALAALALIPILHHLVSRLLRRKLVLPTFRFLATRDTSEQSRKRLIEWLLLFLRTVAILAAVFAWARPVPTADHALRAATEGRLVILLDRSLSMRAVVGGRTRFEEAQNAAQRLIEHAPSGTVYTVIAFDDSTTLLCENEQNAGLVLEAIRSATPGLRGTALSEALSRARESILEAGGAARMAILSDLQVGSLQGVTPGLFRGLDVQWILEPRLLVPAPPNSGIGAIHPEVFDGFLALSIDPSGSHDVARARLAVAGRQWRMRAGNEERTWPTSEQRLAVGSVPDPGARGDSAVQIAIELTGSDCLEDDDRVEIAVEVPRRIPFVIRSSPEARPYLEAVVRSLNGGEVNGPRGAILIGDGAEGARALGDSGYIGALLFHPTGITASEDEEGAWRMNAGALSVDGISGVRVRRRSVLANAGLITGAGEMVLAFDDGKPAAIQGRSLSGAPTLLFAFGADLRSADAVLSTTFPVLVRRSLARLGLAQVGRLLSRRPEAPPDESDLETASIEDLQALTSDSGGPARIIATASPEREPAPWSAAALAFMLFVLVGETLLARRTS